MSKNSFSPIEAAPGSSAHAFVGLKGGAGSGENALIRRTSRSVRSATDPGISVHFDTTHAYIEDFDYVVGSGHLDEHNGRFCVTPEYPLGTYAYFSTLDANGDLAYPLVIGPARFSARGALSERSHVFRDGFPRKSPCEPVAR